MLRRLNPHFQRAALAGLMCFAVLLASCTRSATTATVPTAGAAGTTGSTTESATQSSDQDATMNAVGTQVSGQLTQTAVASGGGSTQGTPGAPSSSQTPQAPAGTGAPSPYPGQATATQGAPAPTQPSQPSQPTSQPADTATPVPAVSTPCPNPYTVQQGDWIYKIARNCGVSVDALIAANPNINPNFISPGQQLNMPGPGATPGGDPAQAGCSGQHVVTTGESLYRLAFTCGLTVEQLAAANNISYPYTIYIGQVLNIP
jgi:LysM repeat protein